jgi:hypothetical protein
MWATCLFVPVLPLGFYRRWHCGDRGELIEPVFTVRRTAGFMPVTFVAAFAILIVAATSRLSR